MVCENPGVPIWPCMHMMTAWHWGLHAILLLWQRISIAFIGLQTGACFSRGLQAD